MSANPAFLEFFAGQWQRELDAVQVPGMPDASWDRKAAYMLWKYRQQYPATAEMWTPEPARWQQELDANGIPYAVQVNKFPWEK